MIKQDLREWLRQVEQLGELQSVVGVNWDLEIGTVTELVHSRRNAPALLFDQIKDYPAGYRVLTNSLGSLDRMALAINLPLGLDERGMMRAWRAKAERLKPLAPRIVASGPVLEVRRQGTEINLWEFPVPRWHELDGGRYLGTATGIVTRDPDSGVINVGTYRVMVADGQTLAPFIAGGKDGNRHRQKYFQRGEPCPVAISFGHHPIIFHVGSLVTPPGFANEYEYAGALWGEPVEVIETPLYGFPVPASAEIVIEGHFIADDLVPEGPFGEWHGYYASGQRPEPALRVEAVYHRHNPIIIASPPTKPPSETTWARNPLRSVDLEDALARAGVPDVTGAWFHQAGGSRFLMVISLRQRYPGHARQAAQAALASKVGAFLGRIVIVVDEDIEITDLNEVMWAVCTRCDPAEGVEILRRCWSSAMDPVLPPGSPEHSSRLIIDACRPYEWKDQFPPVAESSPELKQRVMARWPDLFANLK